MEHILCPPNLIRSSSLMSHNVRVNGGNLNNWPARSQWIPRRKCLQLRSIDRTQTWTWHEHPHRKKQWQQWKSQQDMWVKPKRDAVIGHVLITPVLSNPWCDRMSSEHGEERPVWWFQCNLEQFSSLMMAWVCTHGLEADTCDWKLLIKTFCLRCFQTKNNSDQSNGFQKIFRRFPFIFSKQKTVPTVATCHFKQVFSSLQMSKFASWTCHYIAGLICKFVLFVKSRRQQFFKWGALFNSSLCHNSLMAPEDWNNVFRCKQSWQDNNNHKSSETCCMPTRERLSHSSHSACVCVWTGLLAVTQNILSQQFFHVYTLYFIIFQCVYYCLVRISMWVATARKYRTFISIYTLTF